MIVLELPLNSGSDLFWPIVAYYCLLCNSRIRAYRNWSGLSVYLSIHPSIHPHTLLHDGWLDFLNILHDQVPWHADACKTEFGTELILSNYGHFLCVCKISAFGFVPNLTNDETFNRIFKLFTAT